MPRKAKSKAQYRFLQAVAHGAKLKGDKGLSASKARELVAGQGPTAYKHLPSVVHASGSKAARQK